MTQINKVRISAAFCQFIWMLCYATYIKVESDIIHTEYERLSEEERLQFDSELQQNTIFNAIPQELQLSRHTSQCTLFCRIGILQKSLKLS